jgi:hypothetical protein
MFGTCLWGLDKDLKLLVLAGGAAAICWTIWCCRNDVVFDRKVMSSSLQVIYLAIYWRRTWTVLQKPGMQDMVLAMCRHLEQVLREYFSQAHGW